jgi:hypothetical protein
VQEEKEEAMSYRSSPARGHLALRILTLSLSAGALLLLGAAVAKAATVTVGSPLSATFSGQFESVPSGTWVNAALPEPGANVGSPVNGTVVRWRLAGNHNDGPFKLRVLRPDGTGKYTPVATSDQVASLAGLRTFDTALPIQAGDVIALDVITGSQIGVAVGVTGANLFNWNPSLADGETSAPDYTNYPGVELGFDADVDYTPATPAVPTTVPKKKCKKHKKKHKRSAESAKKKKCKKKKKR